MKNETKCIMGYLLLLIMDYDFFDWKVQSMFGYCPQYDALIDQLTGEETLYMFARLRGVKNVGHVVKTLLTDLLLTEHAHKLVKNFR